MNRHITAAVCGAFLLGACQPLPQPFAPTRANPLLEIADGGGITVQSVIGVAPDLADRVSTEMATALRELDIPASTEGRNRRSRFLTGEVAERRLEDGRNRVTMRWVLVDRDGRLITEREVVETAPVPLRSDPDSVVLRRLARTAATAIATTMRAEPEETRPPAAPALAQTATAAPPLSARSIFVKPIAGAPANGARSLQVALANALRAQRLAVVESATTTAVTVAGTMALDTPDAGLQRVELAWSVLGPDGREIGNLKQQNAVPPGTFDRPWGELATIIAETVAEGIVELFGRIGDRDPLPRSGG